MSSDAFADSPEGIFSRRQTDMLILLGLEPAFIAWHLVRTSGRLRCSYEDLAKKLGISTSNFMRLAWSKVPPLKSWNEHIKILAAVNGCKPEDLHAILNGTLA